jgi:hypothetical protein
MRMSVFPMFDRLRGTVYLCFRQTRDRAAFSRRCQHR